MDAFEGFCDDRFHAEQVGALGGPVAAGAHAVVLAADDDRRGAMILINGGCVVDGLRFVVDLGDTAFGAGHHEVFDADIGEGAAGHHAVIAAA